MCVCVCVYVHATSIMQNLYNRPNQFTPGWAAMDVLHVSRSIVWLSPDYIVVYDRCVCVCVCVMHADWWEGLLSRLLSFVWCCNWFLWHCLNVLILRSCFAQ